MPLFDCEVWDTVLEIIGVLTVGILALCAIWTFIRFCYFVWVVFLPCNKINLPEKYGKWALITGCTDGVGKAYANELARKGLNLVLVSRTEEKLRTTAQEIEQKHSVKTKIIVADFSNGPKAINTIKEELKGAPPIGILVNNVGKQYTYPMFLGEVSEKELWDIININIGAVTMMTRLFIENMKTRGRGAIINVSSGAECQPLPLMNVYAASKVYMKHFTEALREEYANSGVTIQHLSPFFISTKMNNFSDRLRDKSLFIPDARTYAKHAINTLGKVDHSSGYWPHGIQYIFTNIPPMWIRMKIGSAMNFSLRKEYFRNRTAVEITTPNVISIRIRTE